MEGGNVVGDRLSDIVNWGERIQGYVAGMSYAEFLADTKTQDAVIRCLEVIGEAASQILKTEIDLEQRHPDLELTAAYRARNRTAHGYGSVDLATVWQSATVSCPAIISAARKILHGPSEA
jgi:uncharacterized protein with HEPN domain